LEKLLVFDPQGRVSASQALTLAYLAPYHDPTDEPEAERKFDWKLDKDDDIIDVWKSKLYDRRNGLFGLVTLTFVQER
jgi:p38 MAP kinase